MKHLDFLRLYFDDGEQGAGESPETKPDTTPETKPDTDNGGEDGRKTPKYSDDDLDAIINKKFAKWQKQHEHDIDEATKLANMNAQERAEHERDAYKQELEALRAANERAEMEKTARGMLQKDGVNVSDGIVAALTGPDAETTSANVKDFISAYKADVMQGVKDSLAHKTPTAGTDPQTYSHEDIRKEKNTHKRLDMYRETMGINKS